MRSSSFAGVLVASTLLVAGFLSAKAGADGLPVPGGVDTTTQGVLSSTGAQRFIAFPHGGSTLVERIAADTGQLLGYAWIEGSYNVPGVTISGDTSGLSQAGNTLVLIRPRIGFPQKETSMVVIDPNSLRIQRQITLDGDFSFDAMSPDGRTAYLIQYPDPKDPTEYRLRTMDLRNGQVAPGSLLPENDPGEEMRGFPLSRTAGEGGRWQYTLYDGGAIYRYGPGKVGEPFVHAIDTVGRRTLCIDLEFVPRKVLDRIDLQMSASGDAVEVVNPGVGVLGTIDTATGEAHEGPIEATAAGSGDADSTATIVIVSVAALALLGTLGRLALSIRRRRADGGNPDVAV